MAPKNKRLPAAERRKVLLAAAARLFAEQGYDATRAEEIASAAGVSKPVLYRHFDSKKALYLELLRRHSDDLPGFLPPSATERSARSGGPEPARASGEARPSVRLAGGRTAPPLGERLERILDTWLLYAADNPHGWQMLFADAGGDSEIRAGRLAVVDRARAVLETMLERLELDVPADELEPTAEILRGGLASMVLWWQRHPEVPRERLVAAAARLISGLAR